MSNPPDWYARDIARHARRNRAIDVLGAVFWIAFVLALLGGIAAAVVL